MRTSGILLLSACALFAAEPSDPSPSEIDGIIRKFAQNESDFAKARESYTYRQTARIQELEMNGRPGGRWEMISDVIFTPDGKRTERVVRSPVPTLRNIILTPEDEKDMRDVQPFVLTTKEIDTYWVRYLGRETLDEIGCYVFAVKPKKMEPGQRYFAGMIWVDDRDLQIVKSYGRARGVLKKNSDQQFPKFETYREQIDGKYWFPTYTAANDVLYFQNAAVPIKQTIRYEDYKQFKSDVKITFGDEVTDAAKPEAPKPGAAPPTPAKP
jgi:hypothetical protein